MSFATLPLIASESRAHFNTGDEDVSEPDARSVDARVDKHEAVCAVRYDGINARLRKIEGILAKSVWALIGGGGTIIVLLINILSRVG